MQKRVSLFLVVCMCFGSGAALASETPTQEIAPEAAALSKKELKEAYSNAIDLIQSDPKAAFDAMSVLADAGYDRALDRVAYFQLKGIGTEPNAEMAAASYAKAVEAGKASSMLSLGKTLITLQRPDEAEALLTKAAAQDVKGAKATLALAYATEKLGDPAQHASGWEQLADLANGGDRVAELGLLYQINRGLRPDLDVNQIVDQLTVRAQEGDAKAAEVLIGYYRVRGSSQPDALENRQRYLAQTGVRSKIVAEESLYLARDTNPRKFWIEAEEIVQETPSSDYARALFIASRINKNAFVRITQKELARLGYKTGRASGYLTEPTIRSINSFCRDMGIWSECRYGPIKSAAIKAISGQLAIARSSKDIQTN